MSDITTSTIDTFQELINNMYSTFETPNKQIELFHTFLKNLKESDTTRIDKLFTTISDFCIINRVAITNQDHNVFQQPLLKYSNKIYMNIKNILLNVDESNKKTIWTYLLKLSAYTDPAGNAKNTLKEIMNSSSSTNQPQESFNFENIFETEENEHVKQLMKDILEFASTEFKNIDTNQNPLDIVVIILGSPKFKQILENIKTCLKNGSLDISKILILFKKIISSIQSSQDNPSNLNGILDLLTPLLGNMMNIPNLQLS